MPRGSGRRNSHDHLRHDGRRQGSGSGQGTDGAVSMTAEEIQLQSFQIIAGVGCARSCYIDAIHLARDGKFEEAEAKITEGQQHYAEGHAAHGGLVQQTAAGENLSIDLLVVHAEDQLMSAEGFGILAKEFVDVYRKMGA